MLLKSICFIRSLKSIPMKGVCGVMITTTSIEYMVLSKLVSITVKLRERLGDSNQRHLFCLLYRFFRLPTNTRSCAITVYSVLIVEIFSTF